MSKKLQEDFGWRAARCAEALILGLDYVVVAGIGAGKTIPFALPLLVQDSPDKLVLVISPLNTPEVDQVRRLFAILTL
jgi:ATP-dependent helicase YprA (DUF1998 family)